VIGEDLFRQFVVEIDPAARRVRLHDPRTYAAPAGAIAVPLAFRGGHPFVETRITLADGREIASRMNLDIGMNRALTLAAGSHRGARIPVQVPIYSSAPNAVDGAATSTLGAGLFKDRRLIIDYPGKKLYL
jgi:hypothetical protein